MADTLKEQIKSLAIKAGFAHVGIAPAGEIARSRPLMEWLDKGYCGGMGYMRRNLDKRLNPSLLVDGARSVICLAVGYAPAENCSGYIARFARGRDYHKVLKKRCIKLMDEIRKITPDFSGRAFVDSAPVMERSLAVLSGLGYVGKNGCLIVPGLGSYVLLCEIICNLELKADTPLQPEQNPCTGCDACIKSCPGGAILPGGLVDSRRCASYLTIEYEGDFDSQQRAVVGEKLFGCDLCQEVCRCNKNVPAGDAELLAGAADISQQQVLEWTQKDWDNFTRGKTLRRASFEMWRRNANKS